MSKVECPCCGETDQKLFHRSSTNSSGFQSYCIACIKFKNIENKYGLTPEQYTLMRVDQRDCCKICGSHASEHVRGLHVDHNHSTGDVRGLLCGNCNKGLGNFKDQPVLLLKALEYLITYGNAPLSQKGETDGT